MQMITIGLMAMLLSPTVGAQDFRDPFRIVNAQRVNLYPLNYWWTNTAGLNASNAALPEEQQVPVPVRPLRDWVRLVSNEMTNTGFAWIVQAYIQETPDGPFTNQTIVLRHGPFEEKKALDRAAYQYNQATENLLVSSNTYATSMERATALNRKADLYQEMYAIDPWQHHNLGHAAATYRNAAFQAQRQANTAVRRINQLEEQRAELYQVTQGRETLTVDTFALRMKETYQNLPVFDIGLRFGR